MADAEAPLTIFYFAWLRERTGTSQESVTPPADVRTVGELIAWLTARSAPSGGWRTRWHGRGCAVNQDFADPDTRVGPGDEVAFFPPVTGG